MDSKGPCKNMKKNIIIAVLGTIVVIFVILLIIGLTAKDEMVSVPIEDNVNIFKEEFVGGCVGEGSTYQSCACAYDLLEKDMGQDGIINMSLEYVKTEKLPAKAVELVTPCFN